VLEELDCELTVDEDVLDLELDEFDRIEAELEA
jgi:hypothetical protein